MKKEYSETEIKIKNAAKSLFLERGYSATTTRDISKESEINLALLNYYFTSKKKLFEIIMLETFYDFISKMVEVYNDEKSSLEEKLELTSSKYIDMIIAEPHLPTFVVNTCSFISYFDTRVSLSFSSKKAIPELISFSSTFIAFIAFTYSSFLFFSSSKSLFSIRDSIDLLPEELQPIITVINKIV